jgi:signal transduction histidine kinase
MKRISVFLFGFLVVVFMVSNVFSAGTPDQAKKLAEEAAAFFKANGKDKAFAAFNDPKGKFIKDDLFIFVLDMKGVIISYAVNQKMIGKDLHDMKDPDGKEFVKEQIETAKKGSGWVDYKFTNPITKKVQDKTSYIIKLDNTYYLGCGAFK